jgi:hypothetical protein
MGRHTMTLPTSESGRCPASDPAPSEHQHQHTQDIDNAIYIYVGEQYAGVAGSVRDGYEYKRDSGCRRRVLLDLALGRADRRVVDLRAG